MFKGLKDLLIQDDKKAPAPAAPARAPLSAPAPYTGVPAVETGAPSPVLDIEQHTKELDDLIQESPDFQVFRSFATAMFNIKDVIKEEPLRFLTAHATTGKTPVSELLTSVNSYATVLGQQAAKFQETFVASAEREIQDAEAVVPTLDQQIQDLTAKLGELSQQKSDLSAAIIAKKSTLAKATIDFKSILSTLDARYTEVAKKVTQYLGAV